MFSSLILTMVLGQVSPAAVALGAGEPEQATVSQPSERRMSDLRQGVERRRARRARAAAARQREWDEARTTADRLAQVTTARYQAEAARLHLEAQQARQIQVLYPFGYSWYPYPWRPILPGPSPLPTPIPLPVSSPTP
jgi:hypothetical protein